MVSVLRRVIALVALAVGIGVAAGAAPATAAIHASHTVRQNAPQSSALSTATRVQADDWWF